MNNALKFHHSDAKPLIKIQTHASLRSQYQFNSTNKGNNCINLVIEDNGIGFDISKLNVLFEPLRRLVGSSEFEGSGIGLSTARKIVERLGGFITAESEVNVGSKFILTFPQVNSFCGPA